MPPESESRGQKKRDLRFFSLGMLVFLAGLVLFFVLAALDWPGPPALCIAQDTCLCETFDYSSLFRQPINTWTNLFIVLPGLVILLQIGKVRPTTDPRELDNDLLRPSAISLTWGFVPIIIGLGSMFYHASITFWGNFLDVFSMNLLISFLICFDFTRYFVWSTKQFLSTFIAMNGVLACLILVFPEVNEVIFTILVFVVVLFDVGILIKTRKKKTMKNGNEKGQQWFSRNWRVFALGISIWVLITFVWLESNTGGPLCNPNSFFTGHTAWHFGDGLCIYIFFLYGRTERRDLQLRESLKKSSLTKQTH